MENKQLNLPIGMPTFEELFSGNKELFKGLYAEEFLNRPGFRPSPVIRLDMSSFTEYPRSFPTYETFFNFYTKKYVPANKHKRVSSRSLR